MTPTAADDRLRTSTDRVCGRLAIAARAWTVALAVAIACDARAAPPTTTAGNRPTSAKLSQGVTLADAPAEERAAIDRLRNSESWVRRAIAAERLARFDCPTSEEMLRTLLRDKSWQVRCYALVNCARRGLKVAEGGFASEPSPIVMRTALRCRYAVPSEPLAALAERLAKSDRLDDKMLALELILAADLHGKQFDREDLLQTIVMRMDRVETGELSPRLAAITSGRDSGRSYRWRDWLRKNRKEPGLHGGFVVPASIAEREDGFLAAVPSERFVELERHLGDLSSREVDLAIMLDCTASMSGELAECQAGVDALMLFARGVVKDLRVAIVGYRDRHDKWETQVFDFTTSVADARDRLWMLSAEGGGDRPESVSLALKAAYAKLTWREGKSLNAILIGDAPPHPGTGEQCVDYARRAHTVGITTYAIAPHVDVPKKKTDEQGAEQGDAPSGRDAEDDPSKPPSPDAKPPAQTEPPRPGPQPWFRKRTPGSPWRQKLAPGEVEYFAEIAEAGGGRAVALPRDASLIAEIAGITFGDRFQDEIEAFFDDWMSLCR
ncbi:MAG: hypothetical protein U0572_14085 [Phycisphaerales bacterium]